VLQDLLQEEFSGLIARLTSIWNWI
jgi:hypothetical protein